MQKREVRKGAVSRKETHAEENEGVEEKRERERVEQSKACPGAAIRS
jgi:hypothetical protein